MAAAFEVMLLSLIEEVKLFKLWADQGQRSTIRISAALETAIVSTYRRTVSARRFHEDDRPGVATFRISIPGGE
jgi:hypothetical protein